MRIKHWSGYGCVNARLIEKSSDKLVVKVVGMHERGLDHDDASNVFDWLVRRFDKTRKSWLEIDHVDTEVSYAEDAYGLIQDSCIYTIQFK